MITLRNVHIALVIAMLAVFATVLLASERPTQTIAVTDTPKAPAALPENRAWLTSYDDASGYDDITTVACGSELGYQTELSNYVGVVIDKASDSYVLNWRPYDLGHDMQLCGLRVAYRLPLDGGGFDTNFSYYHVTGSALRPRSSTTEWSSDQSGGCLYATNGNPYDIFNINMNIPDGSRIDYLRSYCYREAQVFLPVVLK